MRLGEISQLPPLLRQRWAASRVWAARQAPYLASALLALQPVVVEDPPTGADLGAFPADTRWHVYLEPRALEACDVPTVGFWLVHQVAHLLRSHAGRYPLASTDPTPDKPLDGPSPEQRHWNMATDAEIDDDLTAGDIVLPQRAVTPAAIGCPEGWVAEQYWDALAGGSSPNRRPSELGPQRQSLDCGSACDGQRRPWDCGLAGLSLTGQRLVAREVAQRIKEHNRCQGRTPAGWDRWAEDVLEPAVTWQRVLASVVRRGVADVAGRVDFSYRRPSRRASAVPDVVLPSLRQPLPQVAMVLDTSGSMSDQMLSQAVAEVGGVLRGLGIARRQLRVICCDATAYEAQRVLDAREVTLLGGGGTNMGAGLDAACSLKPRPDLVIVLTDGFTPWPGAAPSRARVVVGLMDAGGSVPPWAHSVLIDLQGPGARPVGAS